MRPDLPSSSTWAWATVPPAQLTDAVAEDYFRAVFKAGLLAFCAMTGRTAPPARALDRGRVDEWLVDGSLVQDGSLRLREEQLHDTRWDLAVRVFVRPPWFAITGWATRAQVTAMCRPIEGRDVEPGWLLVDAGFLEPWTDPVRQDYCPHGVVLGERCFQCEPFRVHLFPPQLPSQNAHKKRAPGGLV